MTDARAALLVLLCSTLFVVSCASVYEGFARKEVVETAAAQPAPAVDPPPALETRPAARLLIPVQGVKPAQLRDNFHDKRGVRTHKALDIMASRGTPVLAAGDGRIAKMYRHLLGGLCIYQYADDGEHVFYYAHLDGFAPGLAAGDRVKRGDVLGYVGTTGNASPTAPHLHFAMIRLDPDRKWYKGTPVNPFPHFVEPGK